MNRLAHIVASLAAAMSLLAAPALAQPESNTVDELVVTGVNRTTREKIETYVEDTTVETPTGQIGRWDKEICVFVTGFGMRRDDYIRKRVIALASEVNLRTGQWGCEPNIYIIATDDFEQFAENYMKTNASKYKRDEWTLRPTKLAIKKFKTSQAPVTSWFVTARVTRAGKRYRAGTAIEGRGLIGSSVRADFDHAVVVINVKQTRIVKFEALADYLALRSLVDINPAARPNVPTVLNLFDYEEDPLSAQRLSDWDMAYLRGTYAAQRDAKRAAVQKWKIREVMQDSSLRSSP